MESKENGEAFITMAETILKLKDKVVDMERKLVYYKMAFSNERERANRLAIENNDLKRNYRRKNNGQRTAD